MIDPDRLDLSVLDPMSEPGRWGAIVNETAARVERVLARRATDPLTLIAGWMRTVTTAGALVIGLLIPVELVLERREAGREQVERLAQLSTETVRAGAQMTGADLARALQGTRNP